jgi:hypothetical protein
VKKASFDLEMFSFQLNTGNGLTTVSAESRKAFAAKQTR